MKPFRFKNFTINQSEKVFRVGTDGVLLGVLATVENAGHILEVGTGTGLISLMLSQRNRNAAILAIDFSKDAAQLASENFKNSPFSKNLKALEQDFKTFESEEKFDVIVSNPPYFEKNQSEKDVIARQQTELSFDDLIEKSVKNLKEQGLFAVIIPFESGDYFSQKCLDFGLNMSKKIKIFGIKNSKPKRLLLEFGFDKKEMVEEEFIIEKSPRIYSNEYLKLTEEFHVFKP